MAKNVYLCSDMKDIYNYSFPSAKSIVVSGDIINEIGYKVKDKGYADLTFRFENGKLESFRQN